MKKVMLGVWALAPVLAFAAPADPSTIVTDASTVFDSVSVLVVGMVGFFIIVKIVKAIRK